MTLKLRCRCEPSAPLDFSAISLTSFLGKTLDEIARTGLPQGMGVVGDWFEISGISDAAEWIFEGTGDWFDGVASGLTHGHVIVEGAVGRLAGTGMRGGQLVIRGNAGDYLGGPRRGERTGMRGGAIVVDGSAGSGVAHRLRRGTIVIRGDVDDFCGWQMVAGTVVIGGRIGEDFGFSMQRGTLVVLDEPSGKRFSENEDDSARFSSWKPLFGSYPSLLGRGLITLWNQYPVQGDGRLRSGVDRRELTERIESLLNNAVRWKRAVGDRMTGGLGEVLAQIED